MTSIRNLPKSLINDVSDVLTKSQQSQIITKKKIFSEGLKRFGASSISELSESDVKAFYSWVQSKLQEASCGCEEDVTEDDMPGDAPFHKHGDEEGEKKKEIDEEDLEDTVVAESISSSTKSKIAAHLSKLASTPRGKDRANVANQILNLMGKDSSTKGTKFEKAFGKVLPLATQYSASASDLEKAVEKALSSLNESIALDADEIATNGAVGVTDADEQLPVHADVLRDSDPVDGKTQFRLFVQFNTNTLPLIVPPVTLPGAPTLDALRDVVEGLPFYCDVCERALSSASDLPHEEPTHSGETVSEAVTPSQADRLVVASVKRLLKTNDVTIISNNSEYLARIPSSTKGEFHHLHIRLEPSQKRLGKQNWVVYDKGAEDPDPTVDLKHAPPAASLPFDLGDPMVSMRKLQELLSQVSKNISSYASQEFLHIFP